MPASPASPIRPPGSARPPAKPSGPNFGALLKDAHRLGASRPATSRTPSRRRMAAGKANIVDVVTAVSETEVAVEALVSVRDRVIAAYEEIMRMPI